MPSRPPVLSKRTRRLLKMDKRHVWHPFTQMRDWLADPEPLVMERASGCTLFDTEGRPYLDGVSSLWVMVHGHNHPAIRAALAQQLERLDHSTLLGLANAPSIELAQALAGLAPKGLSKVFYSDSGSTATEVALKLAFQYWQNLGGAAARKTRFVTLSQAYHGDTIGSVSLGGMDLFHRVYQPLLFPTFQIPTPYGGGRPGDGDQALASLKSLFKRRSNGIAALVLEPLVQGAAGMLLAPPGFLREARRLCDRFHVLLVADEVATGFGRTGRMFACEHEGVSPDLMAVAKGLSGGVLPLAATLATDRVYQAFVRPYAEQKAFFHGHTYTGNPLACAAALASLKLFRRERTLERLRPKLSFLDRRLPRLLERPQVGEVRQLGMMVGIELMQDKRRRTAYPWELKMGVRVCRRARDYGVILRPLGNVIVLMPPLSISLTELDLLLRATERAIIDVTEGPRP